MSKNIEKDSYQSGKISGNVDITTATVSTSAEQDCVFAQLTDMFGDVASQELIRNICISNCWRVDDCIEELIQYLEYYGSDFNNSEQKKETPQDNFANYQESISTQDNIIANENASQPTQQQQENLISMEDNVKTINSSSSNEDMIIESEEAIDIGLPIQQQEQVQHSPNIYGLVDHQQQQELEQLKYLGAIPKTSSIDDGDTNYSITSSNLKSSPFPIIDFSSILKKGFKEFISEPSSSSSLTTTTTTTAPISAPQPTMPKTVIPAQAKKREASDTPEIENIVKNINAGYKVLIIMRGPPGCGKSFLARNIIDRTIKGDDRNHIFSADDYFYDVYDRYIYKPDKIHEAHEFNQRRVRKCAAQGWSPIIVDNTNIKIWEMIPYVRFGLQNGYIIEIVQPDNDWCHSARKLASKNEHGVSKDKIEKMLINFEPITVKKLLKSFNLKNFPSVPQFRHKPPLPLFMVCEDTRMDINDNNNKEEHLTRTVGNMAEATLSSESFSENNSNSWGKYENSNESKKDNETLQEKKEEFDVPKPPRDTTRRIENIHSTSDDQSEEMSDSNEQTEEVEWKSYEEESSEFWQADQIATIKRKTEPSSASIIEPQPQRSPVKSINATNNICNILKESIENFTSNEKDTDTVESTTQKSAKKFERHKLDCKNENQSFAMIRQIYSNKQADGLWDLFEKCNGNVDWVVDILLKDDSCVDQDVAGGCNEEEFFSCHCDDDNENVQQGINTINEESRSESTSPTNYKLSKQKSKKEKDKILSADKLEVKQNIEKQFRFGDQFYSSHVRKIRDLRHGSVENNITTGTTDGPAAQQSEEVKNTNGFDDRDNDDNASSDTSSAVGEDDEMVEINLGSELIQQLESMFGTECDPKQSINYKTNVFMPKSLAKQLYALWMESMFNQMEEQRQTVIKEDENFARILEDPQTYEKYRNPPNNYKEILDMELAWNIYQSEFKDWRTESTPRDLAAHLTQLKLSEIFPNIEKDTLLEIYAAHGNRFADTVEVLKASLNGNVDEERIKCKEKELFEKVQIERAQTVNRELGKSYESTIEQSSSSSTEKKNSVLSGEDAKKVVLKEFEECRNLAVHHSQLKAECYQKAQEAIQKGNTAVAVYYSQIASLHRNKLDMLNHKAANCIMEVHDLNQNNPDFIDLHYLHVIEALQCLDIFIDKHIHKMKNISRIYKYLFIITGRGLHSASGVSTIKNKVKARLKQRNLKWTEVNPGLLKVKVFSASKYSKNL